MSLWQLNFLWWRLIFVAPRYEICLILPFWRLEFWGGFWNSGEFMHLWVVMFFQKDSSKHNADEVRSYCRRQWPVSLVLIRRHTHTYSADGSIRRKWAEFNITVLLTRQDVILPLMWYYLIFVTPYPRAPCVIASVLDCRFCYEIRKSLSLGLARCLWKQSVWV